MGKRSLQPLVSQRVRLRLLEEHDLPQTLAWRNQEHIRRWFFFSDRVTPEQHAAWFERYRHRDDDFVFIIEEAVKTPRSIGQIAIYNIDWAAKRGEFGRLMIGEADAAGRGLAREATETIIAWALNELGLREVFLEVIPGNERAIGVYEACGFEVTERTDRTVRMSVKSHSASRLLLSVHAHS